MKNELKITDETLLKSLQAEFPKAHPLILNLLVNRGLKTKEKINDLISPPRISDPFKLKNMLQVCERIKLAIDNNEKIVICGDYDADGTVSTAMLYRFFKEVNYHNIDYYIPHRVEEGYGISPIGVEKLVAEGAKLLISVDNGIAAFDAGEKASELGVDLIITDHHDLIDNKVPKCYSVLNPKNEPQSNYTFLAGAGVALYLIRALKTHLKVQVNLDKYLLLCTVASVADVVPLLEENRTLVKTGLSIFSKAKQIPGLQALISLVRIYQNIRSQDLGYKIAPMLNAAGRLEGADKTIKLLINDSMEESLHLAEELRQLNLRRRGESDLLYEQIKKDLDLTQPTIVVGGDFHAGVIGVVAGKLKQEFHRPVVIISFDDQGEGKASCRSIVGFNIKEAIDLTKDYHQGGGGHYMAAGFKIKKSQLNEFKKHFNEIFKSKFNPDLYQGDLLDFELTKDDLSKEFLTQFEQLEPFGAKFEYPMVSYKGKITQISLIKEEHLLIELDGKIKCWLFFQSEKMESIQQKLYLKVVGEFSVQNKNPSITIQEIF